MNDNDRDDLPGEDAWDRLASSYDTYLGQITGQAVETALDEAGVASGMQFLDIATGPGYAAGAAHARGAIAAGIDISTAMITQAQAKFSDALFYMGNAESLIFPNEFFDAAVCLFGMDYIKKPATAFSEVFRILKPGARYAFTLWETPGRNPLFDTVTEAIEMASDNADATNPLQVAALLGKPSYPGGTLAAEELLLSAGFTNIQTKQLSLTWQPAHRHEILDLIHKSSVMLDKLIRSQPDAVIENIHDNIVALMRKKEAVKTGVTCPAILLSAEKPD